MKLLIQFVLILSVLFFGVMMGIDTAAKGIYRIEGAPNNMQKQAFQITPSTQGKVEVAVLGQKFTASTPQAAPKIKQEVKRTTEATGNRISEIGNGLGSLLREGTSKGLSWILEKLAQWIG